MNASDANWNRLSVAVATLFVIGLYINLSKIFLGNRLFILSADMVTLTLITIAVLSHAVSRSSLGLAEILVSIFCLVCGIEILHSNVPSLLVGLEAFRRLAFPMLGLLLGVVAVKKRGDIILIWRTLSLAAVPILLYAIKQLFAYSAFDEAFVDSNAADLSTWSIYGMHRAFSIFNGPFHLGIFAGLVFWVALGLRLELRQHRYTLLALLSLVACIASITRASIAALLLSVPVVLLMVMREYRARIARATTLAICSSYLGFLVLMASSPTLAAWADGYSVVDSLLDDQRLQGRMPDYATAMRMISENPLGAGMGSASDTMGWHFDIVGGQHITSHNLLLWVAVETGLFGLLVFLAILVLLSLTARGLLKREDRPLALTMCGTLLVVLLSGLTGSTLSAYPANLVFWTLSGCYMGYLRQTPERGLTRACQ